MRTRVVTRKFATLLELSKEEKYCWIGSIQVASLEAISIVDDGRVIMAKCIGQGGLEVNLRVA